MPHYVLDYESRFREAVIEEFADAYLRGETPIPCVRCNQTVKFHDLLETARDLGAQAMATGHYVRRAVVGGRTQLRRAVDPARDQSYFLFATPATSWTSCAFRSAAWKSRWSAGWPPNWGWRWPTSRTARTSASCRKASTPP